MRKVDRDSYTLEQGNKNINMKLWVLISVTIGKIGNRNINVEVHSLKLRKLKGRQTKGKKDFLC